MISLFLLWIYKPRPLVSLLGGGFICTSPRYILKTILAKNCVFTTSAYENVFVVYEGYAIGIDLISINAHDEQLDITE